ncbi:YraN family protein [Lachnospiraceae bacterium]|nr:YraN family protein [Lachnospiraceae bacterium]
MNKRAVGKRYEKIACQYMQERGFKAVELNFRCRQGEIDIIGYDGEYLVFAEVKYRMTGCFGHAAEAVTGTKQKTICKVADYYRYKHGIGDFCPIRYDVVAVVGTNQNLRIDWFKNAFYHISLWRQ